MSNSRCLIKNMTFLDNIACEFHKSFRPILHNLLRILQTQLFILFGFFKDVSYKKIENTLSECSYNKYILGVGKKASNWAVLGELGRYRYILILSLV